MFPWTRRRGLHAESFPDSRLSMTRLLLVSPVTSPGSSRLQTYVAASPFPAGVARFRKTKQNKTECSAKSGFQLNSD